MQNKDKQYIWALAATAIIAIIGMTAIILSDLNLFIEGKASDIWEEELVYDSQICNYQGRTLMSSNSHYDSWDCGNIIVKEIVRGNNCVRRYTVFSTGKYSEYEC